MKTERKKYIINSIFGNLYIFWMNDNDNNALRNFLLCLLSKKTNSFCLLHKIIFKINLITFNVLY